MFGASLLREYGEVPPQLWKEAFDSMTDQDVRRAMVSLLNSGAKFPPSLPEFVALALPNRMDSEWNTPAAKALIELATDSGFRAPMPWESIAGYRTQLALQGITSFPVARTRGH